MPPNIDSYKEIRDDVSARYAEIKSLAAAEVVLDEYDLDGESLRTAKLHSRWLGLMGDEAVKMKQLQNIMKRVLLDRTRWYMGSQTDEYYAQYGQPHLRVAKTDVPLYIDADPYMATLREVCEIQAQVVDFLEKTVKEISSRTFHIRAAIDWRKFQNGA